jgi:LysM repeat protein
MQPPQQGIPRLLAMKDPTNPILMHMSPMEAAQITAIRGQGFNPQTGLPVLGRAEGGLMQPKKPPYEDIAQKLEEKGRFGDTHLLHVRDDELQGLSSLGQLTINPETGLPEAFSFKSLVPALVGTAVTIASGGTMAPLMAAGLGGLATFGTSFAMGNSLEQSLLSGFMTFGGGALAGGGPSFGAEALAPAAGAGVGAGGVAADMGLASAGLMQAPLTTTGTGLAAASAAPAFNLTGGFSQAAPGITSAAEAAAFQGMGTYMPVVDQAAYMAANPANVTFDVTDAALGGPTDYMYTQDVPDIGLEASALPSSATNQPSFGTRFEETLNLGDVYSTPESYKTLQTSYQATEPRYSLQGEMGQLGKIDPRSVGKPYEQGWINRQFGMKDISPTDSFTRSELIEQGIRPPDATIGEKFQAFANNPSQMATKVGLPVVAAALTTDPYVAPYEDTPEGLASRFSSYTPRERTLVGSRPTRETFEEIQERMLRGSGGTQFQPFSPHSFAKEGGMVGLVEGGQAKQFINQDELTEMSKTPEDQRIRNDTSTPISSENKAGMFFDEIEKQGGLMSIISQLALRNNPEAIRFINKHATIPSSASSPSNNFTSFDTGVRGLFAKNTGGLVGLNTGGQPSDTGLQANSFARGLMMAMNRLSGDQRPSASDLESNLFTDLKFTTPGRIKVPMSVPLHKDGTLGEMRPAFNQGGILNENYPSYRRGRSIGSDFNVGEQPEQMPSIPVSLQALMKRLKLNDPTYLLKFAELTRDVESTGGTDRVNKESSARGDFQWLTKVDPNAKEGKHNSLKTAVNRTIASYKKVDKDIPQWLKTLDKNSTKSTEAAQKNVLSLTPDQELELFFGNMNYAKGSDKYLPQIAQGSQQAMLGAFGDIHHTDMKANSPTEKRAEDIFFSEEVTETLPVASTTQPKGLAALPEEVISETIKDTRPTDLYTVQRGDTLSQLAARTGMSVDDIMASNLSRISDPNKIYEGQQIALSDSPDIPNPVPMDAESDATTSDRLLEVIGEFLPDFIKRSQGGGIGQYYAHGGNIGQYYEGQVVGQGDGMSDEILFEVEGTNPDKALLSRDEYVIPADVVAMLGNGSSNAGAENLDEFLKVIRQQSFGTTQQQQQMNPQQGLSQLV